jgi:DNA-binding MarR family transcriptional regulator
MQASTGKRPKLTEFEARMIGELGQLGALTMSSLTQILGNDKSQVSRALKRLMTARIIQREEVRSALRLTSHGQSIAQKLNSSAHAHCYLLLRGFRGQESHEIMVAISHLTRVATQLLRDEQRFAMTASRKPPIFKIGPATMSGAMLPELLPARLVTLSTLLQRSSSLAFRRLTGLSNARSTLLSYIWEYAPVSALRASELTARSKKRIERDAAALESLNLIRRGKSLSSHDWFYDRTIDGSEAYARLSAEIGRREQYLLRDFSPQELRRFMTQLERIAENSRSIQP